MKTLLFSVWFFLVNLYPNIAGWILEALKSGCIVVAGMTVAYLFARRSSVAKSAVLRATMVGLLATAAWHVAPSALDRLRPTVSLTPMAIGSALTFEEAVAAGVARTPEDARASAEQRRELSRLPEAVPSSVPETFDGVSLVDFQTRVLGWLDRHVMHLWLGGFVLLACWRIVRVTAGIHRLRATTRMAPDSLTRAAEEVARDLGLKSRPVCRVGASVSSPLITGWRRGCLWLPEESSEWSNQQLRAVLLHELAHLSRRDAMWQSLGTLTAAFWWWNPLVWRLLRMIKVQSEFAADELVLCGRTSGPDYAETLVRIASVAGSGTRVTVGLPMGLPMIGRSPIEQRVRAILAENPFRGRAGWMGITGALVILAGGLIAATVVAQSKSNGVSNAPPIKLTDDQRRLAERAVAALTERQKRLRYLHFKLEETWMETNKGSGKAASSPMPTKIEVWTDEWTGVHRAEYNPEVTKWVSGAAPFYIESRTVINDGKQSREYSHRDGPEGMRSRKAEGLQRLLGVTHEQEVLRKLRNAVAAGESGRQGVVELRISETGRDGQRRIEVREELFSRDQSQPVSQRQIWQLDVAAGHALVLQTMEFPSAKTSTAWMREEGGRTTAGDAFPLRYSFTSDHSTVMIYKTAVTLFEPLDKLPAGILDLPKSVEEPFTAKNGKAVQHDHLDIKIVDARTGQPMPATTVDYDLNSDKRQRITADSSGVAVIPLSKEEVKALTLWGLKKGYTMQKVSWSKRGDPLQLPESYVVKLYPASPISGRVISFANKPVKDAKVMVTHTGQRRGWSVFADRFDLWQIEAKTDADGNWKMNGFPDDLTGLSIRVSHPDFRATTDLGGTDYRILTGQEYNSLRDGTSVITLTAGERLAGKVVDENGQPLAGCRVTIGEDIHGANLPVTETDAEGAFGFSGLKSGRTWLSVQPTTHQPVLREIVLPMRDEVPLIVKAEPGRVLRARVVREDGTPCVGLNVLADRWKKTRTLTFETETDVDGRFEWKAAPNEAVSFAFGAGQGREFLNGYLLTASDAEQEIVMRPALRIKAEVVDARTRLPIKTFRVTPGHDGGRDIYWDRSNAISGTDGRFIWETRYIEREGNEPKFLIEADGYTPLQTEAFPTKQQTISLTLQLTANR